MRARVRGEHDGLLALACDDTGRIHRVPAADVPARVRRPARGARLRAPRALLALPGGDALVADAGAHAIKLLTADQQTLVTIAGGK